MKKIILPGDTEQLRKACRWMIGNMLFNTPLSAFAALNEMKNAAALLIGRPDIFRHSLKRHVNEAIRKGDQKRALMMAYHNDRKTFDEFSDNIIDIMEEDVTNLRNHICDVFQQTGITPDAELIAWVETAHILLMIAVQHHISIIDRGNQKAGHNYTKEFRDFCMTDVLSAWQLVAEAIDPMPSILEEQSVIERIIDIAAKYGHGTYLKQCIDLMRHHPLFADMQAEDDGDKIEVGPTLSSDKQKKKHNKNDKL
ncbi:MAG: hypothetical protein IKQ37_05585 [Bacteroidaceae bacterium]|nr:hypothetical protein [Bacteroidaceae bacterium]